MNPLWNQKTIINRLTLALNAALNRYALVMGEPFPAKTSLKIIETEEFLALARPDGGGVVITVSTGVVQRVKELWQRAMELSNGLPEDQQLNIVNVADAVDASLVFLILHELHHHQIGHLDLVGPAGISETSFVPELGLTARSGAKPSALDMLDKNTAILVRRCLELQADHDALEIHLDHYSSEGWGYIRFYMASAMAVMVLIEQQGHAADDDRCYPLSATRIFQIFGALALLWQPLPTSDWDAPNDDEIEAYHEAVVAPAISDAIILAAAGGVAAITNDRTDADDLFEDMRMLQEPHKHDLTTLKTIGAREYASLILANEKAKELLGREKFAT